MWLKAKSHYVFKDNEIFCIIKDLLDSSAGFARSKAQNIYRWESEMELGSKFRGAKTSIKKNSLKYKLAYI